MNYLFQIAIRFALILCSLWSANAFSEVVTNSSLNLFKFKFELNKPLVYTVEIKTRIVSDSRSSLTRNSTESRYKIRLTAISTNQDGTTTVYYGPFDYEQDVEIIGASGRINTSYRGLNVINKQNDIVTIDTVKGVGLSEAKSLKMGLYPFLLSGYMDFNPAGVVTKLDGNLPFIDHWQARNEAIVGFFNIAFPTNTISVWDSWTNYIAFKSNTGLVINGDDIIQANVFTRGLDSTTSNSSVACFNLCESDIHQDLTGYIEQSGQRTSIAIPERTEHVNATFHFDQKLGRLIDMHKIDKMTASTSMMYQGNSVTSHVSSDVEISMRLVLP